MKRSLDYVKDVVAERVDGTTIQQADEYPRRLQEHWSLHGPRLLERLNEVLTDWEEGFRPAEVTSYRRGLADVVAASEVEV